MFSGKMVDRPAGGFSWGDFKDSGSFFFSSFLFCFFGLVGIERGWGVFFGFFCLFWGGLGSLLTTFVFRFHWFLG